MGFVSKTVRHTKRYQQIIAILIKYGMGDLVRSLKITDGLPFLKKVIPKKNSRPVSDYTRPEELRIVLEELGPTFVKLGQMLSNRPDILPERYIKELSLLQDNVPPFSGETAATIVEQELGAPINDLFEFFDIVPIASASIGQVHMAVLKGGRRVAVKVQRPDIEKIIKIDLEILHNMAKLMENNLDSFRYLNPTGVVSEFERTIMLELDYNRERFNLERFHNIFKYDSEIYVPQAYSSHSTKRVFTMDYVEGVKVSRIAEEDLPGFDRKLIAEHGAELILRQIFIEGFFHADPHPGNIVIMDNNRICFLDFGMMGTIMPAQQDLLGSMLIAISRRDSSLVANLILEITDTPENSDFHNLEFEVHNLITSYIDMPLEEINVGEIIESLLDLISRFKIKIPANLVMTAKAIVMIEGIGRQIYPEFHISDIIKKFKKKILVHRINPKRFLDEAFLSIQDYKKFATELPKNLRAILRKARQGKLHVEFEHIGLEPLRSTLDAASYRLVFGVVLAALIIGSAIMVHVDNPRWTIIPTLGFIGFLAGGFFAFLILIITVVRTFKE